MFTRIVETITPPGKAGEFSRTFAEKVLPILREQTGFVDEITLVAQENPDRVLTLSLWNTRQDADKYGRDVFPRMVDLLRNLTIGAPQLSIYDVTTSTAHNIAAAKAA